MGSKYASGNRYGNLSKFEHETNIRNTKRRMLGTSTYKEYLLYNEKERNLKNIAIVFVRHQLFYPHKNIMNPVHPPQNFEPYWNFLNPGYPHHSPRYLPNTCNDHPRIIPIKNKCTELTSTLLLKRLIRCKYPLQLND